MKSQMRRAAATHRRPTAATLIVAPALLVGALAVWSGPEAAAGDVANPPAQVSVDFGADQGARLQTEKYNDFTSATSGPPTFQAARSSDVSYLNNVGLHGKVYRAWAKFNWCGGATSGSCTLPTTYGSSTGDVQTYMQNASDVADSILLNLDVQTLVYKLDANQNLTPASHAQVYGTYKTIIEAVKAKYPKIRYIEAFNEPDAPQFNNKLTPAVMYPYYQDVYQAVDAANTELNLTGNSSLLVGGPTLFEFNTDWLGKFLDAYVADPNSGKRLDYITYHGYIEFGDPELFQPPLFYKDNPHMVADQRSRLEALLASKGLSTHIPAYITETGVYPGPLCDDCTDYSVSGVNTSSTPWYTQDYLRDAIGHASLTYWYAQQRDTYPFNWVTRHSSNERKDQFVTRGPNCTSVTNPATQQTTNNCPNGPLTDLLTPYGNTLLMESMMKTEQVAATSDSLNTVNGIGVYATASKDSTGVSAMVWNYQDLGVTPYTATINMTNLPANLSGRRPVDVKVYRVDQNTSNYYYSPENTDPSYAALKMVDKRTVTLTGSYTYQANLPANSMYLLMLSPINDMKPPTPTAPSNISQTAARATSN
jgi:hypothetical protein